MQYEVIIVDDDVDDRELIYHGFKQNNLRSVALFEDGVSALDYLSHDAIVLPKLQARKILFGKSEPM